VAGKESVQKENFTYSTDFGVYSASAYWTQGTTNAPVVIFLHGFASMKAWYSWLTEPFCDAGYVIVLIQIPNALISDLQEYITGGEGTHEVYSDAFSPCIDKLSTMTALNGIADLNRVYSMGHSAGGLGAMVAATNDDRIKAVVALSPPINVNNENLPKPVYIPCPIQIIVGSNEQELYEGNILYFNTELEASTKSLVTIEGGNHVQFMDSSIVSLIGILGDFMDMPYVGNQPANCTVEYQHTKTLEACIPFLNSVGTPPTPTPAPTPTLTPTPTPAPTPTLTPTPTPAPTPTLTPTQATTPTPESTDGLISPTPTPSPKPTGEASGSVSSEFLITAVAVGAAAGGGIAAVALKRRK